MYQVAKEDVVRDAHGARLTIETISICKRFFGCLSTAILHYTIPEIAVSFICHWPIEAADCCDCT